MPPALYAWVTFFNRVLLYAQADLDCNPPICDSLYSWDDRRVLLHSAIDWDGVSWTFCLGWPQTSVLLSASQVAGLSHPSLNSTVCSHGS
jgi:hypothetical protein